MDYRLRIFVLFMQRSGVWMRGALNTLGLVAFLVLAGCSKDELPYSERAEHRIYNDGLDKLRNGKYRQAAEEFDQFEQQYPYSVWAPKSQVMAAYARYLDGKHVRAQQNLDGFLNLHPYHPLTSYALYLKGLCYYEEIEGPTRDQKASTMAMQTFTELQNRFPGTKYAESAKPMWLFAYNQLAANKMQIGYTYQTRQQPIAALLNFQRVWKNFPLSIYAEEALHRIVECSLALGFWDEVHQAATVLAARAHDGKPATSPWYHHTYNLLKGLSHPKAAPIVKGLPVPVALPKKEDPQTHGDADTKD